jgi:hypothetical protein
MEDSMRRTVLTLVLTLFVTTPAWAQLASAPNLPPFLDVFGGFAVIRLNPAPDLDEVDGNTLSGGQIALAGYPTNRVGVAFEATFTRRNARLDEDLLPDVRPRLKQQTYLVGPSFRLLQKARLSTTLRALIGAARMNVDFDDEDGGRPAPPNAGAFSDGTVFAASIGSAWDIGISQPVAIRLNPSMLITTYGKETTLPDGREVTDGVQVNPRFTIGIVFRFSEN